MTITNKTVSTVKETKTVKADNAHSIDLSKLVTTVADIEKLVKSVNSDSTKLLNKTWLLGSSLAQHFLANRDTVSLNRWFKSIKDGVIRKKALGLWIKEGLTLDYNVKEGFVYNKENYKPQAIEWFLKTNPFDYSVETVKGFDFTQSLKALVKRAKSEAEKNPNAIKQADIIALEKMIANYEVQAMSLDKPSVELVA